ncbi:YraN family protein [Candidatus Saccharibacteria bacterium]|nr:YraN family protein [Candidatus Saccharibacteria bacterium]
MSTTSKGREAEEQVAEFLRSNGHRVESLNWRTRWCEIDIVSTKKKCAYFTEVKYRSSSNWGGGLEYITPAKLKQMTFAAEFWVTEHNWKGEAVLQGAEVDGDGVIALVEI